MTTDMDFRLQHPIRPDLGPLFSRVESLGISCELGLIQRHCEIEPLGLFRFGYTPLDGLIRAIRSKFDQIGSPDELDFHPGYLDEWMCTHRTYGFEFHTGHSKASCSEAEIRLRASKHYTFLGRVMLENLSSGDRPFFYRPQHSVSAQPYAFELLKEMRRHGPAILVWIELAEEMAAYGKAKWVIPGELISASIDRYAPVDFAAAASFDGWLKIVASALSLIDGDVS